MNKKSSKYWHIFTTVIIALGLLNSGCTQLEKFSFGNKTKRIDILEEKVESLSYSIEEDKSEKVNVLEEKVETLSNNLASVINNNYELKKNLNELETVKNQLNEEYTQIKNKQSAIEETQTSQNEERNRLEGELVETKNLLENIKQQLAIVEKDKNNLKSKLEKLEASRAKTAKTEIVAVRTTDTEEEKSNTGKSRKSLIKETQEKRKLSLVEDLLDKAIQLYRQEKFEEAIAKWEEVLALEPGKLEAKFNIEIAQDRIKEKQIQEDLKSARTQRR